MASALSFLHRARAFRARALGYFPTITVALPLTAGGAEAQYSERLGRYEVRLPHDDDETIILSVVLAVAQLEML